MTPTLTLHRYLREPVNSLTHFAGILVSVVGVVALYLLMGWSALVAIVSIMQTLPAGGVLWLIPGGLFYSVGAAYGPKPDWSPGLLGGHEPQQLFVLVGSACYFVVTLRYVLRRYVPS